MVSLKQGHLCRGLAIMFLMFALADLFADTFSPKLCCEGLDGLALSSILQSQSSNQSDDVTTLAASDYSKKEQHSDPLNNNEEYCIFCCAQILASPHFDVAVLEVSRPTSDFTDCILPTPPPQSLFHPPRIS